MKGNDLVAFALRSPLHHLLGDTLLITVTGRKTGRKISLPVNYYRDGESLWILSNRDRTWWRNLLHGGEVMLRLHGHDLCGSGEVIEDEPRVAAGLAEYIRRLPATAHYLNVRVENGVPNCDDLSRLAKDRVFVRIRVPA